MIFLVIPAHNPSPALPEILSEVWPHFGPVVVVDDGSDPEHLPIFAQCEAIPGVAIVHHGHNQGMGAALKTGFRYALASWQHMDGIVAADADGQHAAADIIRVAAALRSNQGRVILGVRDFGRSVPFRSRFGNIATRWIFRLFTGQKLQDTQTGLRGWPRDVCRRLLEIPAAGFDFQLACLLRAGVPFLEVPIQTIYQDGNRCSHFRPFRDSVLVYTVFVRHVTHQITRAFRAAVGWGVRRVQRPLA